MMLSRRQFLECAAGAAAIVVPLELRLRPQGVAVLDLGTQCALVESAAGYSAALAAPLVRSGARSQPYATLIVPAVVDIAPPTAREIMASLHAGGSVILESGAGFASAQAFRAHRAMMRNLFHVDIGEPVDLWPPLHGLPYIEYTWPHVARVRDFSRAVPVASGAGEVIARVNGVGVGLKRHFGRGTLIVLGSPLGPVLWLGDSQAHQWVASAL